MRFTLLRLLLCVAAFAISFRAFGNFGYEGLTAAMLVGSAIGAICLIVKPVEFTSLLRAVAFGIAGAFLGGFFSPIGAYGSLVAQASPLCIGSIVGVVIGSFFITDDKA